MHTPANKQPAATPTSGTGQPSDRRHACTALFTSFLKIGAFTFGGGFAMIPLIEREMIDRRGWIERTDFLELLTLAQSAPGPIALNTAVFVGYKIAGYRGALSAVTGVVLPSFIIILLIAMYFTDFRTNRYVDAAFKGMRPAVVALIAAPVFGLARGMGWWKIGLAAIAALIVWLLGVSPIWFILVGAVGGILYTFYNRKGASGTGKGTRS
ncbi:MAG TPA: chromate transporter [Candidatus Tidjanibacter faecipullorum]|uniref:Chromate transporter n=1 Tax=Candidatus Tidjanibacter faecipullorum TaxID=2838766 RepID=A0A9D2DF50_9BACT|nr:chromate transporter [Candidatus Tidjanibacter faecipullorum]